MASPEEIKKTYSDYIVASRYARWVESESRRESWDEIVTRYWDFFEAKLPKLLTDNTLMPLWSRAKQHMLTKHVMPSMRCLMSAGKALEEHNAAGYNCSFLALSSTNAFAELMYLLMCGSGVGFSVQAAHVNQLPKVPSVLQSEMFSFIVEDTRVGWADAFRFLLNGLYTGTVHKFDYSRIRPAGARLVTIGGRASGPEPLRSLFESTILTFNRAKGRRLTSTECHDIACKVADIVVMGGVRRSATISLSDLNDTSMAEAKSGEWWINNPQRARANNSAVWNNSMTREEFDREFTAMIESNSGERGIFNLEAARDHTSKHTTRYTTKINGVNPCGEILLRDMQACNLSEVILRPEDTQKDVLAKVVSATLLGTVQSTLTDFKFLREEWTKNTKEERLLGVSLTGIFDHPVFSTPKYSLDTMVEFLGLPKEVVSGYGNNYKCGLSPILNLLKEASRTTNLVCSRVLGIETSTAITTVKPSGTVSALAVCSSGLHPAYSKYFMRRVRSDLKDPFTTYLMDQGVPYEVSIEKPDSEIIFEFPLTSGEHSVTSDNLTAIDHLEMYRLYQNSYTEHKPSVTIYVTDKEWPEVREYVWNNLSDIIGVSFLPKDSHTYKQAPYTALTKMEYEAKVNSFPTSVNIEGFKESSDHYQLEPEMSCVSGACSIL